METLKFKVGDKVRVKSLEWYNSEQKNFVGSIIKGAGFRKEMSKYCGKEITIKSIIEIAENYYYIIEEDKDYWEDWMLEDDVVTDNIIKRVLTKEQAQDVVKNTKYRLENKNENASLQKKLFEIGCKWISGCEEVRNETNKYLFVGKNLNITTADSEEIFIGSKLNELEVNDILNIEIKDMYMETKEMTKEEALAFVCNSKIFCVSNEEAESLQRKLFEIGCEWVNINQRKEVLTDIWAFHIDTKGKMQHNFKRIKWWSEGEGEVKDVEEILNIEIEDKPKFNPEDLKPFDKVLVRDNVGNIWRCNLFSNLNKVVGYDYQCVANCWNFCIPYNEETKHLVGTTEDAPEYYQIWK